LRVGARVTDAKAVQVGVLPTHRRLEHSMEAVEASASGYEKASPDHRLNAVENDP
jgi:hypothetical protein